MIHPWHDVSPVVPNRKRPGAVRCIIEIPAGSSNKYELDKATGMLKLDRVLHSAVYYPANYGFVPRTLAEDGDPIDILVFCAESVEPLCLVDAEVIGLMTMIDDGEADHKLIAVLIDDPEFQHYRDIQHLPPHKLRMLERFFEDYKKLEGKQVAVNPFQPAAEALPVLAAARERYLAHYAARAAEGPTGPDPSPVRSGAA